MMEKSDLLAGIAGLASFGGIAKPDARVSEIIETANIIAALSGKNAMGGMLPAAAGNLGDVVRMIRDWGGSLPSLIPMGGGSGFTGLPGFSGAPVAADSLVPRTSVPAAPNVTPAATPATPPAAQATPAAEPAATDQTADPSKLSQDCTNKWLVITIDRTKKEEFGGVWECTLGQLRMELWDSKDAGSGDLIMECYTVERGAARNQRVAETKTMIVAGDDYGINIHNGDAMKTYQYKVQDKKTNIKPRPALAVYGTGFGAVGARSGICIHHGSSHTWSVGCILLTPTTGERSGARWTFPLAPSCDTQMEFRKNVLTFAKLSTARTPVGSPPKKLDRVRLIIRECF